MTDRQRAIAVCFLYLFFFATLVNLLKTSQENNKQILNQQIKYTKNDINQHQQEYQDDFPFCEITLSQFSSQQLKNYQINYYKQEIKNLTFFENYKKLMRISQIPMKAYWNQENQQFQSYESQSGKILLYIQPYQVKSFYIIFLIYDGYYVDIKKNVIIFRITLDNMNFNQKYNSFELKNQVYHQIEQKQYQKIQNNYMIGNLTLTVNQNLNYYNENEMLVINAKLETQNGQFDFQMDFLQNETNYSRKVLFYSTIMTILAILHFYSIVKVAQQIVESESNGDKFSLLSLGYASIWDGYLCILHFYFAINVQHLFQYFLTPSFCFFTLFTVFETRILILIWKSRYYPGQVVNIIHNIIIQQQLQQ